MFRKRNQNDNDVKIVFIGDSSVGKTSLISRMVFDQFDENTYSTIGGAYCSHDVVSNDNKYCFKIWDTAGQERYKSLVPMYVKNSKIIIISFSLADLESYNSVLNYWYEYARDIEPSAHIIIVGTKLDLVDQRQITKEKILKYVQLTRADYLECSSKNNENIEMLMNKILSISYDNNNKYKLKQISDKEDKYEIIKLNQTMLEQVEDKLYMVKNKCSDCL